MFVNIIYAERERDEVVWQQQQGAAGDGGTGGRAPNET